MVRTFFVRLSKLAVVAGLAALVAAWFRERGAKQHEPADPGSASWPPLTSVPEHAPAVAQPAPDPATEPIAEPSDGAAAEAPRGDWVEPQEDGTCPADHPVKVKLSSGIYHVPGGLSYERTKPDRCYGSAEAAEADGYRASKM